MSDEVPEKKIIVDEDWKSQVQAEKEAADAAKQEPSESAETPLEESSQEGPQSAAGPLPAANLMALVTMLASQAMISLGQIPNPVTGKPEPEPDAAKYYIDLLGVLEEKTKGNLTADESKAMEDVMHHLRMTFVTGGE